MKPEQMSLLISIMDNVPDLTTFRWTDNTFFSEAGVAFAYESVNGNKLRGRINESGRGGYIENKETPVLTTSRYAMETLSMNFPTVVFWDPARVKIIESAQPYLEDLRRVKILHDSPESAAEFINKVYEDPMSWWVSPELQQAREKFCYQFSRKSKNSLEEWKEELLKMVK